MKAFALLIFPMLISSPKSGADSVAFKESVKDSLTCFADEGCDAAATGKFTMEGVFFTDADLTGLQDLLVTNTELDVVVGDWIGIGLLGDDPKYKNGNPEAMIRLVEGTTNSCSDGKRVLSVILPTYGTVKFSASSKGVVIRVLSKYEDNCRGIWGYPAIYNEDVGVTGSVTNSLPISIVISNAAAQLSTNIDLLVIGRAAVKSVVKGGATYDLNSLKLRGGR
jgi:hypothetical protein